MMRSVLGRPASSPTTAVLVPTIVITAPDEPATPSSPFFMHRPPPPGIENGLLQVPRRVSARQQHQQHQQQQQQRPQRMTVTTPLIKLDRPPPRLARYRPLVEPIPLPEPVQFPATPVKEEPSVETDARPSLQPQTAPKDNITTATSGGTLTKRSVLDTLKGLEKYCESLVVNARARPQPQLVEPVAPKPVAATSAFKKAHRRVHSVDISWNRAPPSGGRPGIATLLTPRRKRSISSSDEIFIGAPKATLARSERSTALARRLGQPRTTGAVLPDLIEDVHQSTTSTAPGVETRTVAVHSTARVIRSRSMSTDTTLANLLSVPQPTMLSTRSGRADLTSLFGATSAAASNSTLLPEGFDLMPAASLGVVAAAGYYASLTKNAATFRQKVFKPLRRYITV